MTINIILISPIIVRIMRNIIAKRTFRLKCDVCLELDKIVRMQNGNRIEIVTVICTIFLVRHGFT